MGKSQPAQLVALVLYGFFLLHGAEGRAESHRAFGQAARNNTYQAGTKSLPVCSARELGGDSDLAKLLLCPAFTSPRPKRFWSARLPLLTPQEFLLAGAREFYIRTGLSPPR